jgi:hypothetical protein
VREGGRQATKHGWAEDRGFEPRMGSLPNRISSPLGLVETAESQGKSPESAQLSASTAGKATEPGESQGNPARASIVPAGVSIRGADLAGLVASVEAETDTGLTSVGLAEDEIEQAIKRHPDAENDLYHSFNLLVPTIISPAWSVEFVYRGHCRELLERIATGQDARLGTAAECAIAIAEVSMAVPLHGARAGFYQRMWSQAFPDHPVWEKAGEHYEALYRQQIDEHEAYTRRKLSQPTRRLIAAEIDCDGEHWGRAGHLQVRQR